MAGYEGCCKCGGPVTLEMINCAGNHCGGGCYHLHCVGLTENLISDEDWFCEKCTQSSDIACADQSYIPGMHFTLILFFSLCICTFNNIMISKYEHKMYINRKLFITFLFHCIIKVI